MEDVSRPGRQHLENLYGQSVGLAQGVRGGHGAVDCTGAALPRRVRALLQDRNRGGRAHDPNRLERV